MKVRTVKQVAPITEATLINKVLMNCPEYFQDLL